MTTFVAVATLSLVGYSRFLFKENRTRQMRPRAIALHLHRIAAVPEPENFWRTLVAAPGAERRPAHR